MLNQLVQLLDGQENGMSLTEISRALKAQPTAVLSMIDLLVRKDKLIEIGPDGKCCTTCHGVLRRRPFSIWIYYRPVWIDFISTSVILETSELVTIR